MSSLLRARPLMALRRSMGAMALALAAGCAPAELSAEEIVVGPNGEFGTLQAAADAASPGDTIIVLPGEYRQCAVVRTSNLTIRGAADGPVTFKDVTCIGKGILVVQGNDVTVDGITFVGARVVDRNGAGIRAEGENLTVRNSVFLNNENGILANPAPDSTITIVNSTFEDNGVCDGYCSHGVYVGGEIRLLRVIGSTFHRQKQGHHVKSRARRTEVLSSVIRDGSEGTASYLIELPNGGDLLAEGNTLQKGAKAGNTTAAIVIGAEGATNPTGEIVVRSNTFRNDLGQRTIFVWNLTSTPAEITDNTYEGSVREVRGDAKG